MAKDSYRLRNGPSLFAIALHSESVKLNISLVLAELLRLLDPASTLASLAFL